MKVKQKVTTLAVTVLTTLAASGAVMADEASRTGLDSGVDLLTKPTETAKPVEQPAASTETSVTPPSDTGIEKEIVPVEQPKTEEQSSQSNKPSEQVKDEVKAEQPSNLVESDVVAETPKAEKKEEEKAKDEKSAESEKGIETVVKPITVNPVETPVVTEKGETIVGTQEGNVIVQVADGSQVVKAAEEVGAKNQKDGTVVVKDEKGKEQVLPSTGTVESVGMLFSGFFGLLGAAGLKLKGRFSK